MLLSLDLAEVLIDFVQGLSLDLILFSNVLQLFSGVRNDDNSGPDFVRKLGQLLIPLFNFLIKRLILDLKLLKVDQMESISQLFFLLKDLLTVSELVPQLNVLKSVLMYFRVLGVVCSLPIVNAAGRQRLTISTEHCILGHRALQLFKLVLNLLTLGLLFIELSLEFRSHSVVALLCLLEVESYLVDVSQSVEVLMLVEESLLLLDLSGSAVILLNYSGLQVTVNLLENLVLGEFILDSSL